MYEIEWLSKGSAFHEVEIKGNTLQVTPTDRHTPEGLTKFTEIVDRALADGYHLLHSHRTSRVPGDFYDIAVFVLRE
jgi:hypothetical protein